MRKELFAGFAVLLACALLTACAALQDNQAGARLAVQVATLKVIDDDADKAAKVLSITADVRERLAGTPSTTIAALDVAVREQIPWGKLDTAERLLVDALLIELRAELEQRVGDGLLDERQRLLLATVVSWIESAARMSGG